MQLYSKHLRSVYTVTKSTLESSWLVCIIVLVFTSVLETLGYEIRTFLRHIHLTFIFHIEIQAVCFVPVGMMAGTPK